MHFLVFAHVLNLLLIGLGNGEASEVEVSIVLDQTLAVADVFEAQ